MTRKWDGKKLLFVLMASEFITVIAGILEHMSSGEISLYMLGIFGI